VTDDTQLGAVTTAPSAARPRRPWHRADATTALLHWLVALLVLLSLATGFRIGADVPQAMWAQRVATLALQGEVVFWHILSASMLVAAAAGYVVFLLRARLTRRVALGAAQLQALRSPNRRARWRSINRAIYWFAFALLLTAAVTGVLRYLGFSSWSPSTIAALHRAIAWSFAAYVALHVTAQVSAAGWRALLTMLVPRFAHGRAAATAAVALCAVFAAVFSLDALTVVPLRISTVTEAPLLDGDPADAAWQQAKAVTVQTHGGAHLIDGAAPVTIKAVRHGSRVYFLFEWPDPTRSQKHHPLQKTAAGWRMVQDGYDREDENTFYEDKFAVMLAQGSRFAALRAVHLGPRPLDDRPGSSGNRGLHYTTDGSVVDVWHWMSVRTNPIGQAEDDHFGPPGPPRDAFTERYAGGYSLDPATTGGSMQNWKNLLEGAASRRFDGGVVPRFLPADSAMLAQLGRVDLDPTVSDEGEWWFTADQMRPFTPELDAMYPVGTVVPSIVHRRPMQGDRADVAAAGTWSKGWWRVEMSREMDTRSPYDVAISNDAFLWVAVFDRTQTRHSRHLRPLRFELP
jgi:hypothetical protein